MKTERFIVQVTFFNWLFLVHIFPFPEGSQE